jgi:hypothetical protein
VEAFENGSSRLSDDSVIIIQSKVLAAVSSFNESERRLFWNSWGKLRDEKINQEISSPRKEAKLDEDEVARLVEHMQEHGGEDLPEDLVARQKEVRQVNIIPAMANHIMLVCDMVILSNYQGWMAQKEASVQGVKDVPTLRMALDRAMQR